MTRRSLHPALAVVLLLSTGCAMPWLRPIRGSDRAGPARRTPTVSVGSGCGGVTVTGPSAVGRPTPTCAQVGDTLPEPGGDRTQPRRPTP